MKKIIAIVLMAAVMLCCTACGLDMSKVKGDWTLETIAGKTVAEVAEKNGVDPAYTRMNATVTDDSFTLTSATGTLTYKIQVKANGFECLDDSNNIFMSVAYDSAKDTLNFKMKQADGSTADYVLKKGTADLTIPAETGAADNAGEGAADNAGEGAADNAGAEDNAGTADNAGAATAEAGYYTAEGYYTGEAE